ncbi:MAG: hypothetical protein F2735_00285 [Actinobacteria bacterium]|uniref:Unannotated protein n=1 Tax=freshwater metagenome TaxID=449393 RepID=A0A6J6WSG3_9ZZZZ|nr:hypothetical protein [Actinomycetota bacterium]
MTHENESSPSGNWGHFNAVDYTSDTDNFSPETAERHAYDQAEIDAEAQAERDFYAGQEQAELDAEALAEREWMEQGGETADHFSLVSVTDDIAHLMMHLDEAIKSIYCATGSNDDDSLSEYLAPADFCVNAIFQLLGVDRPMPLCLHCGDEVTQ